MGEYAVSTDAKIISGIVRNGVVVPQANNDLPDGAHVNIVLQPAEMPKELKDELEAWQRAGDQAWQMIDKWESEEQ
jgi:predicted DNA-binding antitoxin AbrB/MazE fold protein